MQELIHMASAFPVLMPILLGMKLTPRHWEPPSFSPRELYTVSHRCRHEEGKAFLSVLLLLTWTTALFARHRS